MEDVFITGTSIISSFGNEKQTWEGILSGDNYPQQREYTLSNQEKLQYPVYQIEDDLIERINKQYSHITIREEFLRDDKDFKLLFLATLEALRNANLHLPNEKRIGLIIGHENLGVNPLIDSLLQEDNKMDIKNPINSFNHYKDKFFRLQTYTYLYYLAKLININGPTYAINNACASGQYALELANSLLKMNHADIVIVVAGDYAHFTEHLWLSEKGFSSNNGKLAPFTDTSSGSVLGDGVGAIILESETNISRRNAISKAKYINSSFSQDTWRINLPDVTTNSYEKVIKTSLSKYKGKPELVIPHGTGIPLWDKYESNGIKKAFESFRYSVPDVTAFKGYIGHTLGANSLIELILGINILKNSVIPPITHRTINNSSEYDLPFVNTIIEKEVKSFIKTVAAYGGFNAATIIEKI